MNQMLMAPKSPATDGDMTGFLSPDEPGVCDQGKALDPVPAHDFVELRQHRRPLSLAWVSDELITETQRLWSERYGREVSVDEAIEILQNIKRFAEMLLERSEA